MADTYALISSRINIEKGEWYLYEKQGFDPMILFHKEGYHGRDVRRCYHTAGWKITVMKFYTVDDDDVN